MEGKREMNMQSSFLRGGGRRFTEAICSPIALVILLVPEAASAQGQLTASWDVCPNVRTYDEMDIPDGIGVVGIWVTGLSETHCGYRVAIEAACPDAQALPDAWRFDSAGCEQTGQLIIQRGPPAIPVSCSDPLRSTPDTIEFTAAITYDSNTGHEFITFEVHYSPCESDVEVLRRYYLGRFIMSCSQMTVGSSTGGLCGGAERGVCIRVKEGGFWSTTNEYVLWQTPPSFLSASVGPDPAYACSAVPAKGTTWGQIKRMFR
jgi:hypothetical protein